MRSDEDSEAKADQAATEIVELVEQEMFCLPSHGRATHQLLEALTPPDADVSDIPEHILAESREMSKEVTPRFISSVTKGKDKTATAARRRS